MARILSRTLIRWPQTLNRPRPLSLSLACRFKSSRPEKAQLLGVDLGPPDELGSGPDIEALGLRKRLVDAVDEFIIRRSAPDWLPFIPGSSYFVAPRTQPITVFDFTERQTTRSPVLTREMEEEMVPFASVKGWPSTSYFVRGVLPNYSIEDSPENASPKSDDECNLENILSKSDGKD